MISYAIGINFYVVFGFFLHIAPNFQRIILLTTLIPGLFSDPFFQIETHVDGERVRYFQDDDNVGLQEMVRREKMSSAQDQNALYSRMAAKVREMYHLFIDSYPRKTFFFCIPIFSINEDC